MVYCFVPDCNHYSERGNCNRWFSFPKKSKFPVEFKKWKDQIRREDTDPTKYSRVCSCHFRDGEKRNGPEIFERSKEKLFPPENLKKRSRKRKIAEATVSKQKIAEATVSKQKMAEATVSKQKIAEPTVSEQKIAEPTVSKQKIAEATVSKQKIAEPTVSEQKIAEPTVSKQKIADPTVSKQKIAEPTVSKQKIAEPTVSKQKIAEPTVSKQKIAEPTVSTLTDVETHDLNIQPTGVEMPSQTIGEVILQAELEQTKRELSDLKQDRSYLTQHYSVHKCNDDVIKMETGLPGREIFDIVVEHAQRCKDSIKYHSEWTVESIKFEDQIFITLMKLRQNYTNLHLAKLFDTSSTTIANVVITFIHVLHNLLFTDTMSRISPREKNKTCLPSSIAQFSSNARLKDFKILNFIPPYLRCYKTDVIQLCTALVNLQFPLIEETSEALRE